jgi:uncharacterized protein
MSGLSDDLSFRPAEFTGKVRLFPLPNLAMFPYGLQPLHIFEPRYRALVEEALASDRLLAMALLKPGWEGDYEGRPPMYPIGCLGRIASHQRLDDGRFNLLLVGLRRIAIERELAPEKPFREAEAALRDDIYRPEAGARRAGLQRRLIDRFRRLMPNLRELSQQLDEVLVSEVPLGMLTDILAFTLKFDLEVKEQLLREADVDRRAELLLTQIEAEAAGRKPVRFPPDFSMN